jgi:hypothetical protein
MCLRLFIGRVTTRKPVEQENQRLLTNDLTVLTWCDCLRAPAEPASPLTPTEDQMKASVVALILDSKTEEAIGLLSRWYKVSVPRLGIGVVEGKTKGVAAVYSQNRKEILAARREYMYDPFVMIHEFYHHLRSVSGHHRGTEKQADRFALDFIDVYRRAAGSPGEG